MVSMRGWNNTYFFCCFLFQNLFISELVGCLFAEYGTIRSFLNAGPVRWTAVERPEPLVSRPEVNDFNVLLTLGQVSRRLNTQ